MVTGASSGLGAHFAKVLAGAGASAVILAARRKSKLESVAGLIESNFPQCQTVCVSMDVMDRASIKHAFQTAEDQLGGKPVSVLINNAGVTWSQKIEEFTEKAWDKVVDLDLKSPFFLSQQVLELLKVKASPQNRSVIINISSVNGIKPSGLQNYSYVAAKAGLQQLSAQMARDLNEDNINVNVIAPGPYKSKMTAPLYSSPEVEAEVMSNFSMGRWGAIEDAAGLSIFLSSKAGSFITGSVIASDGGDTNLG